MNAINVHAHHENLSLTSDRSKLSKAKDSIHVLFGLSGTVIGKTAAKPEPAPRTHGYGVGYNAEHYNDFFSMKFQPGNCVGKRGRYLS